MIRHAAITAVVRQLPPSLPERGLDHEEDIEQLGLPPAATIPHEHQVEHPGSHLKPDVLESWKIALLLPDLTFASIPATKYLPRLGNIRLTDLESQVVQLLLQLWHRVGPRLAVLHHLGEEQRERGQRHLLFAPRQRLVEDGRLGADHGRGGGGRRRRHGGSGGRDRLYLTVHGAADRESDVLLVDVGVFRYFSFVAPTSDFQLQTAVSEKSERNLPDENDHPLIFRQFLKPGQNRVPHEC